MSQERSDSIKVLNIFCSSSIQEVSIYFTYTFWNNYANNYPMQYFIRANKFDLSNQRMTLIKWVCIVSAKITTQRLKNPSVSSCIILKYVKWCNDTQDCKVKHYLIHSTLPLMLCHFLKVGSEDLLVMYSMFMNKMSLLCHKKPMSLWKLFQTTPFDFLWDLEILKCWT